MPRRRVVPFAPAVLAVALGLAVTGCGAPPPPPSNAPPPVTTVEPAAPAPPPPAAQVVTPVPPHATTATAGGAVVTRRALLVGVTRYPGLPPRLQLEGPANDVLLMRTTLVNHFGVPAENIVTLSEAEGAADHSRLPTRANIEREFRRLAEVTQPGDEVVVLLGGHGSQQPERPGAAVPEFDGLDETFLPRDIGPWSNTAATVTNAITDDDLGEWVAAIRAKQAFACLVVDSCHSGTMIRADATERPRKADPTDDLGVPRAAIEAAAERARGRSRGAPGADSVAARAGVFAVYASQPTETTPERPMPPDVRGDRKQHGVLTYTVCRVLTQAKAAGSPLTYRELGQRVHAQYVAWGRTSPTPMVEYPATDPDREVLGPGAWKGRSRILVARDDRARVNAGLLLGLTPGSVLEVRPPAGAGDDLLGYVRVTAARPLDADVAPEAYNGVPAPAAVPDGARCKVEFVEFGETRLPVAVAAHYSSAAADPTPVPAEPRGRLAARLEKAAGPEAPFRAVADPKDAAWLLAPHADGRVSLLPAAARAGGAGATGYGPVPADASLEAWVKDVTGRIARAEGLVKLAASRVDEVLAAGDTAPKYRAELFLSKGPGEKAIPLPWPATDLTVYDKDAVRVRVTNTGRVAFDLTVLYVGTDHSIGGLFPTPGRSNRLFPGNALEVPIGVVGSSVGGEHLALIAVKAEGPEVNYLGLTQDTPAQLAPAASRGDTPAGRTARLLGRGVFGLTDPRSGTRGSTAGAAEDHSMLLINWQVRGTTRPTN